MTDIDKTSPNAVRVRQIMRSRAISVFEKADEFTEAVHRLAHEVSQADHLVDGDREDTQELIDDLRAAELAIARIKAKAGLIARRTKTSTTITVL